jgi:hypothetical protein
MFRDMLFYIISLFLLLLFFMDEIVDWYEAAILFALYIVYGIAMKFNTQIERAVKRKLTTMSSKVGVDRKGFVEVSFERIK